MRSSLVNCFVVGQIDQLFIEKIELYVMVLHYSSDDAKSCCKNMLVGYISMSMVNMEE